MVYPAAVFVGNSPNQDPRRQDVSQVIIHHTASTGDVRDILNMFMQDNSRSVSANFLVAQNGDVYEVVNPDTGRAWTTGSGPVGTLSPDHSAITMEVMDETGAPGWTISEAAQESVSQIIAWAAERYGFTPVRGVNVRGHREMPGQSTACPGGMPLDSVTARGIDILNGVNKKGFLMALNDTQQQQIYDALVVNGGAYYQPAAIVNILREEIAPAIAKSSLFPGQPYNGFLAIINELRGKKTVPVDIDEKVLAAELAPALAPLIAANAGKLSDEAVNSLVKTLLDEQSKRLAS